LPITAGGAILSHPAEICILASKSRRQKAGNILTGPLAKMAAGRYLLIEFESQ
jgi:hypothetical protein